MAIDWAKHENATYFNAKNVTGPMDLTIAEVVEELVGIGADQELKVCVYVVEDERNLVLNVDRREALRDLFGDNTDDWKGGRFRLVVGRATFQGKAVKALFVEPIPTKPPRGGIRAARPAPEPKPAPEAVDETPAPDSPDWETADAE